MTDRSQIITPVVDLMRAPNGPRDRQVLFGETVRVHASEKGWSHVQADKDSYTGYVPTKALGPTQHATHSISAPSTHVYSAPDLKSPDLMALSFGSRIAVTSVTNEYAETSFGYVPAGHIKPVSEYQNDPIEVAQLFLGTPYLWGGNSRFGIDCSGLVQAAYLACGHACPGDSQDQQHAFGSPLPQGSPPERNDLLFFQGHVAMVFDSETLLHANAFHMAVSYEPLQAALARIEQQGDGPVTAHTRPDASGSTS